MKTRDDIFLKDGRLHLHLADDKGALKGFEVPKNKLSALIYHDGELVDLNWIGVQHEGEGCDLVFYEHELVTEVPSPLCELSSTLRPHCFEILRRLSYALEAAEGKLYTNLDSIPLSNAWVFPSGDILILTTQLGDIVDRFEIDEDRHTDKEIWFAHNCQNHFGKAHFLFQLFYYSLTGKAPFQAPEVRENGFKAVPMALNFPPGDERLEAMCKDVDLALSDNRKFQFGVRDPYRYFRDFLDRYSDMEVSSIVVGQNPSLPTYWARVEKKARRRAFFRTKGFRTAMITLGVLAVLGIIAYYVWQAVKPPLTRDLNEVEIIEYYYDALTNLDVSAMDEPLKSGYDGPDTVQVSTLFVTSSMQKSYSGGSLIVNPNDWIAEGMGPLAESSIVYGVTDVSVEQISEDVFRATILLWTSENQVDETNSIVSESGMEVYKYKEVLDFTFKTRKDWREIKKIELLSSDLVETIHVDYKQ